MTAPDQPASAGTLGQFALPVMRTARVATAGGPSAATRELWIVLHGYGQLAPIFIRHFAPLADGTRWILAPEALSRFYHEMPDASRHLGAPVGERRVGATWLTREEREHEIADAIAYLDAVHASARARLADAGTTVDVQLVVLGFSQGVATACRWLARPHAPEAAHFVGWCGPVPLELADAGAGLRARRATLVVGERDEWLRDGAIPEQEARLTRLGVAPALVTFAGGHRMDASTLRAIA